jgi:hypothetical protein
MVKCKWGIEVFFFFRFPCVEELIAPILSAKTLADATSAVHAMNATLWRPVRNEEVEKELFARITAPSAPCNQALRDAAENVCPELREQRFLLELFVQNASYAFRATPELEGKFRDAWNACWFNCGLMSWSSHVR